MGAGTQSVESGDLKLGSIGQFAIKSAIVVVAIIVLFSYISASMESFINRNLSWHLGGAAFWSKFEDLLDKQAHASTTVSPEAKKRIVDDIRMIANEWRPFIQELASAATGTEIEPPKP